MNDDGSFQRFAALAAIVSLPVAFAGTGLTLMSAGFDTAALNDPAGMLAIGRHNLGLMNWGMLLYLLGYFLLWIPLALFLRRWLNPRSPNWAEFYTFCGLLYIVLGAIASALALGVHPRMITAYADASGPQREMIVAAFASSWYAQVYGLTGIAQHIPAVVWWLGLGALLRQERRALGNVTLVLGVAALVDALATVLALSGTLGAAVFFLTYVVGAPIWALWLGVDLWRKPVLAMAA